MTPGPGARPLVSLFVMAYAQEAHIRAAVAAAFAQSYEPLEILLSDDASPDGTYGIMEEMAAAYDGPHRVILNRNPVNLGIVPHVNACVARTSGRFVVHATGDDLSAPDRVSRLAAPWIAGAGRIKAVHSRTRLIDGEGRDLGGLRPPPGSYDAPTPLSILTRVQNPIGATMGVDRTLFERFGPIPEDCFVEDAVLFFRAAMTGGTAYVDAPLIGYRTGGASMGQSLSPAWRDMHGDRIRSARWRIPNMAAHLADMEAVEFPEREACRARARHIGADAAYAVMLAGTPWWRLPLRLRAALSEARRAGHAGPLKRLTRYLAGRPYRAWYDLRAPEAARLPPPGHPEAHAPRWVEAIARRDRAEAEASDAILARTPRLAGLAADTYVFPSGEGA